MRKAENTAERVAEALAADSEFVKCMARPLAADEETVTAVACLIAVEVGDVERGYALLYERREALREVLGDYGERVEELSPPAALEVVEVEAGDLGDVGDAGWDELDLNAFEEAVEAFEAEGEV